MKAFTLNGKMYELIEVRGSYYYGKDNRGKIKIVPIENTQLDEVEGLPKPKVYKKAKPVEIKIDPVKMWADIALSVNDQWNQNTTWQLAESKFGRINANGNEFIQSLLDSMFRNYHLSEKQAYYLAKYGVETGQLN